MLEIGRTTPSTESPTAHTLAELSRNASVISTSSSDSSPSLQLKTPPRPRPIRTFTSPRNHSPGPQTPRATSYTNSELGIPVNQTASSSGRARSRLRSETPTVHDFTFGVTLGEGSYSTVKHVIHKATQKEYAIKILEKSHLLRHNKVQTAVSEKNSLIRLGTGHPGIVRLHWAFQDESRLYFVIDLATNGEMQSRIVRMGSFSLECARYYTAQIVDAVDYMHSKDVIHRDLKPENVLLDSEFRIKLTDFGTGKIVEPGSTEKPKTFVGTAQYVSPELLEANETSKSSDLWALGCIVYQMITGRFAFQGLSEYLTWQKVKQLDYSFPDGFDSEAQDLVQRLLVKDPSARLGAGPPGSDNDMQALRSHPFLSPIDWSALWTEPPPPLQPGLVVREHHPLSPGQDHWGDIGAAWDELVDSDADSDGLEWASEHETTSYEGRTSPGPLHETNGLTSNRLSRSESSKKVCFNEPSNPVAQSMPQPDEDPPPASSGTNPPSFIQPSGQISQESGPSFQPTPPMPIFRNSLRAGSLTSSSEGSPVERLGAVLDSMMLPFRAVGSRRPSPEKGHSTDVGVSTATHDGDEEVARGRLRTPVQPHAGGTSLAIISSMLTADESILHSGEVEARAIRRRASRLISLAVSPTKPKSRQLVLTNQRLICFKPRSKIKGEPSVKLILPLKMLISEREGKEREKEKESRAYITQVEAKGEREFVVLTSTKTFAFGSADSDSAALWINKINNALRIADGTRT